MPTQNHRVWASVALLALVIAAASYYGWSRSKSPREPASKKNQAVERPRETTPVGFDETPIEPPGYLGMESCAACHAERVAEFRATNHARTCRLPRAEDMPPGFDPGKGSFVTRYDGLRFEMSREGDDYIQTSIHASPSGQQQRRSARVDMVYGAGTVDDIYLTWHGDRLDELPMAWLYPIDSWASEGFDPYGSGDFSRALTPRCLECHNTWFEHLAGTPNQYKREHSILGVTCERCHGPGREHVEFHRAHPEAETARHILHPGELSRELELDVCVQCHGNAIKHREPAFSYRPGEPLEASYMTVSANREDDHVANQIYYLRQSKCFEQSETLTCVNCHDPHTSTDPQLVRASCLDCHEPEHCGDREHLPVAVRDNCVGCHMPRYIKMNVNFDTADELYVPVIQRYEHRIAVYPMARKEVLRDWYRTQSGLESRDEAARLTDALVEHWLGEAERFRNEYRYKGAIGAIREALRIDPESKRAREKLDAIVAVQAKLDEGWFRALHLISQQQVTEAIAQLKDILANKPDHAGAHGRLGTLHAMQGEKELAEQHLKEVAKDDPNDAYGEGMLGWLAYLDSRPEDALEHYRQALEIEPRYAKLFYQMGLARARLNRMPEAISSFQKSLEIDPNGIDACRALIMALVQQRELDEALPWARRAVKLTNHQDLQILMTLAEVAAETGQFDEAVEAAGLALQLARLHQPSLASRIQQRLEELRQLGRSESGR
ncbi:MAG: tetratricopeptide repeat protein [Planctomycetota bacterium]|nr:tetratricopeptide repeat protein [Planctomycetota bacterium]